MQVENIVFITPSIILTVLIQPFKYIFDAMLRMNSFPSSRLKFVLKMSDPQFSSFLIKNDNIIEYVLSNPFAIPRMQKSNIVN